MCTIQKYTFLDFHSMTCYNTSSVVLRSQTNSFRRNSSMKFISKLFVAMLIVASIAPAVKAQDQFTIAASSSTGTYAKMLGEIIGVCSDDRFNISEAHGITGGAPGNLDALINNKAQAAFLHSDVFFANAMADPSYSRYQTLVALYPEPIHVLALRQSKTSKLGMTSFGKQEFNSLSDAKGFKVGAAGGGVYTARILTGQGDGGFEVVPFDKGDDAIAALNNGTVALVLFVGAAPLPNLEKLNKSQYKLLPVGENIANRVATVYRKDITINYPGLTSGPLKTLAPMATLLTRKYSTEKMVNIQRHFRDCFNKNLDALKDTGSPNWQSVEVGDHGVLPWYEIPGGAAVPVSHKKP